MELKHDYENPEYYENRELSWVLFNQRVLGEAKDVKIPLFDRLKFLRDRKSTRLNSSHRL